MNIKQNLKIVVVVALISVAGSYFLFSNNNINEQSLDKIVEEVTVDWNFYKNIGIISQLLDSEAIEAIGEDFEEEDGELRKIVIGAFLYKIKQDDVLKNKLEVIKNEYDKSQTKKNKLSDDSVFEKNTACASLVPDIKNETGGKFEYIFYSPTLNNCIYSVNLTEDTKKGYRVYKNLYNTSSNNEIGEYLVYVSYNFEDYLGNTGDSFEESIFENKANYIKFVLENSNYDFALFDDLSNIYNTF